MSRYAVKRHGKSWKCFELCSIEVVQVGYVKQRNAKETRCGEGHGKAKEMRCGEGRGKAKE